MGDKSRKQRERMAKQKQAKRSDSGAKINHSRQGRNNRQRKGRGFGGNLTGPCNHEKDSVQCKRRIKKGCPHKHCSAHPCKR